jgi:hypothetical protein
LKKTLGVAIFLILTLSRVKGEPSDALPEPEYYYTRVMYTGVGTPERGGPNPFKYPPIRNFRCSDLARGEGGLGAPITRRPIASLSGAWNA